MDGMRVGCSLVLGAGMAAAAAAATLVGAGFVAAGGSWSGTGRLESALVPLAGVATGSQLLESGPLPFGAWAGSLAAPRLEVALLGADIQLHWSAVPGATQYRVWTGSPWGSDAMLLAQTPDTSWIDGDAAPLGSRWYHVTALRNPMEETR